MVAASSADFELRLMTFNIWRNGGRSLDKTIEAIRQVDADVVGLQECDATTAASIASSLRFDFATDENGNAIASRWRIVDVVGRTRHRWGGLGVKIEIGPDLRIFVFDAHLHYTSYGPYLLQDGQSDAYVLEQERAIRMPGLNELLSLMADARVSGEAVFLVGDFNAPSHLDYTSLAWPESVACYERGLADSYRILHPENRRCPRRFSFDEPGITWTPLLEEEPRGCFDRIDFIYYAPSDRVTPTSSVEIDASNGITPWPSDHRAVVSTFSILRHIGSLGDVSTTDR